MRAILLPVKDLRNAKQRLAQVLTPEERFALARAMLADTVRAVQGVQRAEKIFVVTNYIPAMQLAQENGWEILREQQQISESVSVDAASLQCHELGISALLRLPVDVPLARAADIDDLLHVDRAPPAVVIVPSRDGTGTNAIMRTPPTLFSSHFGTGSFEKHCAEARCVGAAIFQRRNARLEMDVDDVTDLRALGQHDLTGTETGMWLQNSGVWQRLNLGSAAMANVASSTKAASPA